ncbi:LamG domain-containing protein [Candidatus Bathyarchaeota archaeon A05DMB-2]|nr:LamG domain-containing protein [Candidatus Bathyarchaeota archaeon A05DMB-2]
MKTATQLTRKTATWMIAALLLTSLLGVASVKAQAAADPNTVALWHLDEVLPDGYREITPDATGQNPGILIHAPAAPELVEGKFGKAMSFDGDNGVYVPIRFLVGFPPSPEPIYIPVSTSLDIPKEVKIEAWINVQGFKNVTYNNIVVKCTRTDASSENVTRIFGIAVKAGIPQNGYTVPTGALSGYVYTDTDGFNEIVTTEPVVPIGEWIHVAFTRTNTGMHLYVNGAEKTVKAIYGTQNPQGDMINGTEVYLGHDAEVIIDEVRISNLTPELQTVASQIDIGPNLLVAVIGVAAIFAVAWLLRRVVQMWVIRSRA